MVTDEVAVFAMSASRVYQLLA